MIRITVGHPLTTQLRELAELVELVDETGQPLGNFVPRSATITSDDCPYNPDQLRAMQSERGGRPLSEIWRSLGAK